MLGVGERVTVMDVCDMGRTCAGSVVICVRTPLSPGRSQYMAEHKGYYYWTWVAWAHASQKRTLLDDLRHQMRLDNLRSTAAGRGHGAGGHHHAHLAGRTDCAVRGWGREEKVNKGGQPSCTHHKINNVKSAAHRGRMMVSVHVQQERPCTATLYTVLSGIKDPTQTHTRTIPNYVQHIT